MKQHTSLRTAVADQVRCLPQVHGVRQTRVRRAGPDAFVDLTVVVAPNVTLGEAHGIASQVEGMVQRLIPRSDVAVRTEPSHLPANGHETVVAALREAAKALNLNILWHSCEMLTPSPGCLGGAVLPLHGEQGRTAREGER